MFRAHPQLLPSDTAESVPRTPLPLADPPRESRALPDGGSTLPGCVRSSTSRTRGSCCSHFRSRPERRAPRAATWSSDSGTSRTRRMRVRSRCCFPRVCRRRRKSGTAVPSFRGSRRELKRNLEDGVHIHRAPVAQRRLEHPLRQRTRRTLVQTHVHVLDQRDVVHVPILTNHAIQTHL